MKEQIQERPGTWRLLISSVLIVCAQVGLAAANEFSVSLSDAVGGSSTSVGEPSELLVRFVQRDTPPVTCPDLVGPRTPRAVREAISGRLVAGASVHQQYDGVVPTYIDQLISLPGVGRKTANVVLGTAFGIASGVVVDTHVKRLSNRLGLTTSQNPVVIERDLMRQLPKNEWIDFSHRMICHGRRICKARNPNCLECAFSHLCLTPA